MGSMTGLDAALRARREGEALAHAAFERLTLPDVPTVDSIVDHVARLRGRRIVVEQLPGLAGTSTCGWWLAHEDRDEILIAPPQSTRHRDAVVLHEVGHLVLDLTGVVPAGHGDVVELPRSQGGGAVQARRSHFDDAVEVAAELLADTFHREIRRGPRAASGFLRVFT